MLALFHSFIRYGIIGVGNTLIDFTIYSMLTRGWMFWKEHYLIANGISFSIVVTWSFFWNKHWAFQQQQSGCAAQYLKFVMSTIGGIAIAQGILYSGVEFLGFHDIIAKLIAGPFVVSWNFFMYRWWAFRGHDNAPRSTVTISSYVQ
ncbi:GtrA family protein [Candidatus Uhrbacteria bacterium]|nr:GtrA family protein [Candidatus Uhrbacteria bacterium]